MRDTLLLVLACVGGTSVVLTACIAMWVAGNACVDWYDRIVAKEEEAEKVDRVSTTWEQRPWPTWSTEIHPHRHAVIAYNSLDHFLWDVQFEVKMRELSRRAGARGESDG